MKPRTSTIWRFLLAGAASVPLLQMIGCTPVGLFDAVAFEVSNLFASVAFDYTQVIVENLLDL